MVAEVLVAVGRLLGRCAVEVRIAVSDVVDRKRFAMRCV